MPYGYCLQERFGRYVLTQIDYRNGMKYDGWNYKVELNNERNYRFTNMCFEIFGTPEEGEWRLVNPTNSNIKRCIYLHDRDQMITIVTMLNLTQES